MSGVVNSPLFAIFSIVVSFATWIIFIRFLIQLSEVDKKHPYVRPLYRLSAVVDVFTRIIPTMNKGKISLAALALLWLLQMIEISGKASLLGESLTALELFFGGTMFAMVAFFSALKWTILASVIASFVVLFSQKIHPIIDIVMQLAEPLIMPFRKISPNLGMFDIAPLFAMLGYGLLSTVIGTIAVNILNSL